MTIPLSEQQDLLLGLLGTNRIARESCLESMGDREWQFLMNKINQHRLAPLLHWRLEHDHSDLAIPDKIKKTLSDEYRESAITSLMIRRELIMVHRILDKVGIPHPALKGAYLAFFSYPHPAIRPLRDLDILVPVDQAIHAYEALLAGGLEKHDEYRGNPEAALLVKKHLPPLLTPNNGLWIELHTKLSHSEPKDSEQAKLAIHQRWDRVVSKTIVSDEIPFLSPTDTLLHLIIHAAYDHKFSNGPLILSDLSYLIQNDTIDWDLFWECARLQQVTHGCVLVLKMTERYYGRMDIDWGGISDMPDDSALEKIARLMLRDDEAQGFTNLRSARIGKSSYLEKLGLYAKRLFPSKIEIAARYPVALNSIWLYFWYPVWWSYIAHRVFRNLTRRKQQGQSDEVNSLLELENWLDDSCH